MNRINYRPQVNSVLAMGLVVCLFFVAGIFFDFYYDLNDDVLIKDIVSGAYTGIPDAHSIQMLYPVSLLICLFYKIIPALPWMGIFLCGAHGLCFYLIAKRSLTFVNTVKNKAMLLLVEAVLILTLFLWELLMVQYTITAALLAACACFLVFTSEKKDKASDFWKEQIPAILLVILAFNVRSEMLLLMSPFIALTGILKWSEEKEAFAKENWKKYLGLVGMIAAGMVLSLIVDFVAYSGQDWKSFRDFFDARTKVYDYTWYPDYEQAEDFYRDLGVTSAKYELINNYNFGLDESIDADLLWSIADYAEATGIKESFVSKLKTAVVDYKWRTFNEVDSPYNFLVLASYGMVIALAFVFKDKSVIWKLPVMVVFRTIPWMYVIWADRVPARISHPLYYIEFVILCAWMLSYMRFEKADSEAEDKTEVVTEQGTKFVPAPRRSLVVCAALLGVYAIIHLPTAWQNVETEMQRRASVNEVMEAFDVYAKQNSEKYYYIDVYSSVAFSEKMFEDVDNSQKNYDILGGWASGSPLQKQAAVPYHEDKLSRAELLLQDNFYFVCEEGTDTEFLEEFYSGHGMIVSLVEADKIETEYMTLLISKLEITCSKKN